MFLTCLSLKKNTLFLTWPRTRRAGGIRGSRYARTRACVPPSYRDDTLYTRTHTGGVRAGACGRARQNRASAPGPAAEQGETETPRRPRPDAPGDHAAGVAYPREPFGRKRSEQAVYAYPTGGVNATTPPRPRSKYPPALLLLLLCFCICDRSYSCPKPRILKQQQQQAKEGRNFPWH